MLFQKIAAAVILSALVVSAASAQKAGRKGPILRQVDHIVVESEDPAGLFSFFADTLLFPIAWPVAESQGNVSAGVGAGNVNLAFFRRANPKGSSKGRAPGARFAGIAFEPYPLANSLRELETEGIPYDKPEPYVSNLPTGTRGVLWTTVVLPSLSRPGMSIFLYEYSPAYLKVDIRRRQLGNRLLLNRGGPLGVQSVSEIVISAVNLERDRRLWTRLLGAPSPSGIWLVGAGPAIRLVEGAKDRVQRIVFKVESLKRAEAFLRKERLLGSSAAGELFLKSSRVQGLSFCLKE